MAFPSNDEAASQRELFAKCLPCLIAALVGLGLMLAGLRESVLDARLWRGDWRLWWGLMHCSLAAFLWLAAALRLGWLVPCVIVGILCGEFFGLPRLKLRFWGIDGVNGTLIPLLIGAATGYFVGILLDVCATYRGNTDAAKQRTAAD